MSEIMTNEESKIYIGTVLSFKKKYGFIEWSKNGIKQKDMFCHYSDILMNGYKFLKSGQKVQFEIGTNHSGNPKAINVKPI